MTGPMSRFDRLRAVSIAEAFRADIARVLPPGALAVIDRRNAAFPPDTCATHDFTHADIHMKYAFELHGIDVKKVMPYRALEASLKGVSPALTALWNEAWAIARATGFAA